MPSTGEVSHGDILFQIGELKGQMQALILVLNQKHEDLNGALGRIGALEKSSIERPHLAAVEVRIGLLERAFAKGVGIAIASSFILPIVISAAKPLLHFGGMPEPPNTPESINGNLKKLKP